MRASNKEARRPECVQCWRERQGREDSIGKQTVATNCECVQGRKGGSRVSGRSRHGTCGRCRLPAVGARSPAWAAQPLPFAPSGRRRAAAVAWLPARPARQPAACGLPAAGAARPAVRSLLGSVTVASRGAGWGGPCLHQKGGQDAGAGGLSTRSGEGALCDIWQQMAGGLAVTHAGGQASRQQSGAMAHASLNSTSTCAGPRRLYQVLIAILQLPQQQAQQVLRFELCGAALRCQVCTSAGWFGDA